jgi:hypothetical protein
LNSLITHFLSAHPAVLRPLSTGDIIGFYNTIIIPAAKDYLHAMVDGRTPLHPPPGEMLNSFNLRMQQQSMQSVGTTAVASPGFRRSVTTLS